MADDLDPRLVRVEPVGTRTATNVLVGSLVRTVEMAVYPPHPEGEALRHRRVELAVSLREAAKRLGLSAVDLSGLEHGRLNLRDPDGWAELRRRLG